MKISLTNTGKRYNRDWIFRNFSYEFIPGKAYAITGPNGSGKSTLLQVIGGATVMSEGDISYQPSDTGSSSKKNIEPEQAYRNISIAAPYLETIEEMTVTEFLRFHSQFKTFLPGVTIREIVSLVGLEKAANKQIRYYSSGMKQRVKLAQAIFSDTSCLLLDEPITNLDSEGVSLYKSLVEKYTNNRLVIVSSNDEEEYFFCGEKINVLHFK
jgi:ABC-type multidrug transport system ATPase subunit